MKNYGGGFFANCYEKIVKDGGTMAIYGGNSGLK